MAKRQKTIDGIWRITRRAPGPRGAKRNACYWYAIGRCGVLGSFHKRTIVKELWVLSRSQGGPLNVFKDPETDKNIHATFDNMLEDGLFEVIEDYGKKAS